jgi:hypothetical protein
MAAQFLLQTAQTDGVSPNPFRRGGTIRRWTPWKTISKHPDLKLPSGRDRTVGIQKVRIRHMGRTVWPLR